MKPGIEIGNYVLAEQLEQGGTGEVWLAYRELGAGGRTAVAIKFPHAGGVLDPRVRDGLDDEARLQMQLQHSNIPRVIDLGLHEGLPYFVMDHIAGYSLAELLECLRDLDTPLRFELVAHIAREIGYALRYAHGFELDGVSRPVLHRDVAPSNVLLSGQGAVYVVDFGVSEAAGIHSASNPVKGTRRYMAPEHALGFPTPKSDGWGLGAIMWEMIEGRPFRAEVEADDLHRAAKQGRHEPLTREGIPEVLRAVTEGLLQVDDRERFTLDEALRQLEAPDLPVQRMALANVLTRCFGDAQRPGPARPEAEVPEPPPAAAKSLPKVIRDDGPFGLNSWSAESEDDVALPPPPAWASMEEPVVTGTEPERAPSGASEPNDVRAADGEASGARPPAQASRPTQESVSDPPMIAVLDLGDDSSSVQKPSPAALPIPEIEAPTPAAPPRKPRSPAVLLLPVLGLALVGVVWAVWPRGGEQDARTMPPNPAVPVSTVQTEVEPSPSDRLPVGPPVPEPVPTDAPPLDAAVPEPVPEPVPTVDPDPVAPVDPVAPKVGQDSSQPAKPKSTSTPPRKKSGPPAQLAITLRLFADMELEINGQHFSLGVRRTAAKTTVAPGKARVRWRRPLGKWKSKSFDVDAGARYEVLLDDRGVTFKALKQ